MSGKIIIFSGKGGSGKTTLSALVLRQLIRQGQKPVLAVDADPNSTLALTLGIEGGETLSDLRDSFAQAAKNPTEIPKQRLLDRWLAELLNEQTGFDLLTMGRPEGPKCYCYVNGLLRRYLSLLRENYAYILVDCEAGMEYISRLVVDDVETAVFVAETTRVGLTTVERIARLADSLSVKVRRRILALNKVPAEGAGGAADLSRWDGTGIEAVVEVPHDADLTRRSAAGEPVDDSAGMHVRSAIEELARRCLAG